MFERHLMTLKQKLGEGGGGGEGREEVTSI